jgi:hypothetical protein
MTKNLVGRLPRRRSTWIVLGAGAVALAVALALFQPWKLWVNQTVDEALPVAAAGPTPSAGLAELARGTFVSHEHATTGTARVLQGGDGSRYLRLENLATSNGPLLKVWLTDATVRTGSDGWHVFDDGRHLDLGALKGNKGSQNYPLPPGVDLATFHSVTVWCARFHVSFGAAELARP